MSRTDGEAPQPVRVLYSDLDGTMVGPFGCFVRAADGTLTTGPAEALVDLHRAGIALVLVSGRSRPQLQEAALLFGADGFVGELGAMVGWDHGRRTRLLPGDAPADFTGPLVEQLESVGLVDALMARHPGRLEHHAPWHAGHETDVMLRGRVDVAEVDRWLRDVGYPWLVLADNGIIAAGELPDADGPTHVYHLMSRGVSKGRGVAADLERRGLTARDAVAVGDSLSDLDMAGAVDRFFLVANGAADPAVRAAARALPNVTVCEGSMGAGWAEAVRWAVARR